MSLPVARVHGVWSLRQWLRTLVSPSRALQPTTATWTWRNAATMPKAPDMDLAMLEAQRELLKATVAVLDAQATRMIARLDATDRPKPRA